MRRTTRWMGWVALIFAGLPGCGLILGLDNFSEGAASSGGTSSSSGGQGGGGSGPGSSTSAATTTGTTSSGTGGAETTTTGGSTSSSASSSSTGGGCTTSAGCPVGQACNTATHTCSTSCDGTSTRCNGGCRVNLTCAPGTNMGASGVSGLQCATNCVLGACVVEPTWGGGSCECGQDSHCNGSTSGTKCVGPPGSGVCGCLSNADCASNSCNLVGVQGFNGGYCQ